MDGRAWTPETLPDEMIANRGVVAVGADGVALTIWDSQTDTISVWYRRLNQKGSAASS